MENVSCGYRLYGECSSEVVMVDVEVSYPFYWVILLLNGKTSMSIDDRDTNLLHVASRALKNSYSPYSRSKVGAGLLTKKGNVYYGCNVENASFSITSCAERNAIAFAISAEGPSMIIEAIAVMAEDEDGNKVPITPCGACRQAISEFGKEARIIFMTGSGEMQSNSIDYMLPNSYSSETVLRKRGQ